MVDPAHLAEKIVPPPVRVEEVVADRKRYAPQDGLQLPPLTRDLEINYTALSFVVPQKVHFRYKLEGRDAETPGRLVSNMSGRRFRVQGIGAAMFSRSWPVSTNPLLSRDTHPESHCVRGDAPAMTKTCLMDSTVISPESLFLQDTCSRWSLPSRVVSSLQ